MMHNHFRQANYPKFWNTDDGPKALDFGRTALRFPVEMVCRRKPIASAVVRPFGFVPFFNQFGHASQGMVFVFQIGELVVIKLCKLAAHEPFVGFAGMVRFCHLRSSIVVLENVSGQLYIEWMASNPQIYKIAAGDVIAGFITIDVVVNGHAGNNAVCREHVRYIQSLNN
jgi:hypothetical protein